MISKNQKKILIIFPDDCLSHSPTILNLTKLLSYKSSVKVIGMSTHSYSNSLLASNTFELVSTKNPIMSFLGKTRQMNLYNFCKVVLLFRRVYKLSKRTYFDEVIAVDSVGVWIAQKVFERKKVHFLSLEIRKDYYFNHIDLNNVSSIIIQTPERLEYLFGKLKHPPSIFYIQNSPIINNEHKQTRNFNGEFLYIGSVIPSHGIISIIEFLRLSKEKEFRLTLKGFFDKFFRAKIEKNYFDLIESNLLVLDDSYVKQEEILSFVRQFSIGFCFYDFNLIKRNDYNYISCPSGKLFNYFAAGLPVIGSNILGLHAVEIFQAGKLLEINDISPTKINDSVDQIIRNYKFFSNNSKSAGKIFDFRKQSQEFINFIT